MSGKRTNEPRKEQPKTDQPESTGPVEEKKEESTDQGNEKPQQIKVPPELKTALDSIKGNDETYADVIQRLLISKTVADAPEGDMVVLRMTKESYRQVLAFQPAQFLSEVLRKAKVS